MEISINLRDKAQRLVDNENVTRVKGTAFIVLGESGNFYSVWLADPEQVLGNCECAATVPVCSHLLAAAIFHLANPEPVTVKEFRDAFEGLT